MLKQKSLLEFKQQSQLVMTYGMQQALHVLQLPILELAEWVALEIEKNPLLIYEGKPHKKCAIEQIVEKECSLFEHLMHQASQIFETEEEMTAAETIIGNLDEKGFLSNERLSEFEQEVLAKIQTFEPLGIAACNVQQSLLLQLQHLGKKGSLAYQILQDHYDDFLHNRLSVLQKKLGYSLKDIKKAVYNEIRSLNLYPGLGFRCEHTPPAFPDLVLTKEEESWQLEISDAPLPQFQITEFEENLCYQPYKQAAKWLVHILDKRKTTLQAIGNFLLKKQRAFFNEEQSSPNPLCMLEVAEELGLHESTISRAIAHKYVATPQGLFPLRHFFQEHKTMQQKIVQLIEKENKEAPYSDEILASELKKMGLSCARRTISKYRKKLKIPQASLRKKW